MADISKITLPNGESYDVKDTTARNNKTNTSVLPNDSGEIKTKYRISQKGFTNGVTWYYPLCKLRQDNAGNYASLILSGRVGGWTSDNMSSVTSLIWNRNTTGIALFDIAGSATVMSSIWNICDIVVYTNSDTTDTVYLKCNNYFTFDVDIEMFQSDCTILYDGNYLTTTPSGTLTASASTSTKRAEFINGKLYIAGSELAFTSSIPTKTSQLTNDSGFKTTDNNTTYSLSKSGNTITLTGSDGSTTSVTDTDTNTWRGIQDNLTSNSTTDSLSAAQGKALKALIDGKADNNHTHTKSEITDLNKELTSEDLNTIRDVGFYYATGSNSVINKPSVDAFGLIVIQSAGSWVTQILYASNMNEKVFLRWYESGTWTSWTEEKLTDTTYTASNGVKIESNVIKHTNSITEGTVSGSSGTLKPNSTISIPSIEYDAQGHIKSKSTTSVTLPANVTASVDGFMSASDKSKLDGIATGATKNSINTYDISIAVADWTTNSNGGYKCIKTVSGILATDEIFADVSLSSDITAAKLQVAAWSCICNGNIYNSADNTVDFYCYDTKPSAALTVRLTVVR